MRYWEMAGLDSQLVQQCVQYEMLCEQLQVTGILMRLPRGRCAMNLSNAMITGHAQSQMVRRQISEQKLRQMLNNPEEILPVREGRVVAQGMSGDYLLRVFVDVDRDPPEVVTAYRTSRIDKYRRSS